MDIKEDFSKDVLEVKEDREELEDQDKDKDNSKAIHLAMVASKEVVLILICENMFYFNKVMMISSIFVLFFLVWSFNWDRNVT